MRRWRWVILLGLLPVYIWLLMTVGTLLAVAVVDPGDLDWEMLKDLVDPDWWAGEMLTEPFAVHSILVPALVIAATQIAFVLPAFSVRLRRGTAGGRPLWITLAVAALVAGMLTAGLFLGIGELLGLWSDGETWPWEPVGEALEDLPFLDDRWDWGVSTLTFAVFWGQVMVGWLIWMPIIALLARRSNPRRLHSRLVLALLGGTILEVAIIVPIDVMVRRRTSCYCETGTFIALCCSIWAMLWLAGPGIVLAATSRRRRLWAHTHCLNCGYAKGPTPGEKCPECGFDWTGA